MKENQKIEVARPVACRPRLSDLKSFWELGSGAVNSLPPAFCVTAAAVVRPRTLQLQPTGDLDLVQDEAFGSSACYHREKVSETNTTSNVLYKPVAKLISKATVSLLSNFGSSNDDIPRKEISEVGDPVPQSDLSRDVPQQLDKKANASQENSEDNRKSSLLPNKGDLSSSDGHSWRKYGQKQVKGSEYPRSYYKCTCPNCPVRKIVETKADGQTAEVVYKGEHNHSKKPESHTCSLPDAQNLASDPGQTEERNLTWANQLAERFIVGEGKQENLRNGGLSIQSSFSGANPLVNDPITAILCNASTSTSTNSLCQSGECGEVSESLEVEGDDFRGKRTKYENQLSNTVGKPLPEPRIVVQNNNNDSDIIGDGFRWRKYGQKVVKGNLYPRSYYRCTSPKCNARKYVERTSEDTGSFITTYEGRHNHDMPTGTTNSDVSKRTSKNKSCTKTRKKF